MSLKAIASVLGLSVTTVSRALNGYDDVAEDTRKRIEEEASRRGYRPNAAARQLKTGRTNTVGLVIPDSVLPLSDSHFTGMLQTIDQRLAREDIDLLMLADKPQDQQRTLRMLRSRAMDALIVTHTTPDDIRLQRLQQKGFRFLSLGRSQLSQPYAWFDYDNHAGVKLATEHFLAKGLTRLGWIGSNEPSSFVRDRRQGFLDAIASHQPPVPVPKRATVAPSRRAGYQQTSAWLASAPQPQAIITDCSPLGEGAAIALQQAGRLSGPQAIPLFVYDGLPHDSIIDHPVNSILQCSQQHVGEKIAEMVLQLLDGTPPEQVQALWQPRLLLTSD
ncbi:LacI family DNA-binding transcriptional regulator [Pantoea cypripedii]|uniref:Transcriptional regulator n=1 Tax=Pantoea cypripedii TaxID=55209 RepID=A0A1X1F071_PANCY|nr:LacI family DNA-binding transcriptional regulator [Pantoea cypripedii]MBP2195826.1 LacI family transcriptional regulator [Pantoea cypripedii]ORM95642.1 transcriptional regulator [Pantoea cypripedii]